MVVAAGSASVEMVLAEVVVPLVAVMLLLGGNHLRAGGPFLGVTRRACPNYPRLWRLGPVLRWCALRRVCL